MTGKYLAVKKKEYVKYSNNLDNKFDTLAEYLKKMGYYTAAFVSNPNLRMNQGFEQGFESFSEAGEQGWDSQKMTVEALNLLNNYQGDKPIFIWLHYLEPHIPYTPSKEFLRKFENDRLYKENDKILELDPDNNSSSYSSNGYIPKAAFQENKYNLTYYIACYDAEILQADYYIGRLLNGIKDDTIVILTADHGESLGEHGKYFTHAENIYDELLSVPLIIKDSRYFNGGRKITAVVSTVDIVPTIMNRIAPFWYFFNKNRFNGLDLSGMLDGKNTGRKYIYSYYPWALSIRDVREDVKYIKVIKGMAELYFLPDEYANHINDGSLRVIRIREKLRKELKKWKNASYPITADINSKKASLDDQTKELLKSVGYLK